MTVVNDYSKLAFTDYADTAVTNYATPAVLPIRTTGTQAPVFCIHPIEGLTSCYAELVEHVGEDRPVYGVQAISTKAESLSSLAALYADEIVAVQASGTVHLLGVSFGGVLAHAIAVELQRRGVSVGQLVLVSAEPRPQAADTGRELLARMGDVIDRSRAEELLAIAAHNGTLAARHFPGVFVGQAVVVADEFGGGAWHPFISGTVTKYLIPDARDLSLVGELADRFF